MRFADIAAYFDKDPVYDAYTGDLLFKCHTSAHDDHTSSGSTSRRRTMTTNEGTVIPARRAVTVYGEPWIVGNSNPDYFQGAAVRRSYDLKKSTGLMERLTPGQACLGVAGVPFYAHREYFRDTVDTRSSADWDIMWNIYHAPGEGVVEGSILRQGGVFYRARTTRDSVEQYGITEADQLDADALQSAVFVSQKRSLVTEQPVGASVTVQALQMDMTKFFEFRTQGESKVQPGDRMIFIAQSAHTPAVGAEFTMQGLRWRVLSIVPKLDAFALHARLV
jgi:hypothetical protein